LLRAVLRAPDVLYRHGLGWVLGHRFLELTHVGRASGRTYRTVVEVLRYDAATGAATVMAGFGPTSDWFRNLEHAPARSVTIGRSTFVPCHRVLDAEEAAAVLADYERRNRLVAPLVRAVLGKLVGWRYDGSPGARRRLVEQLPLVELRPATGPVR
jgi:deazaflavin-dependent oxidoreductase (nitroreductase family)